MPPINTALEAKYFKKDKEINQNDYEKYQNWPQEGRLVFQDFSVKYRKNLKKVLKKINLEILPGEKVK